MYRPVLFITASTLTTLITNLTRFYPKEGGGFLFGSVDERNRTWINHYVPIAGRRDEYSFAFRQSAIAKAYKQLPRSASGTCCLGFVHTHPYPEGFHPSSLCQSTDDALTQIGLNLKYSLILGLAPGEWGMTAWEMGFAAPVEVKVWDEAKNRTNRLQVWLQRNRQVVAGLY